MSDVIVLDTGPAGQIAHPKPNREIAEWLQQQLLAGKRIILPEIVDYELRRNFILEIDRGKKKTQRSLDRLDTLKTTLIFLPINSEVMLMAAQLWADARRRGKPTADRHALDGDVILAAQTLAVGGVIVTDNVGHLDQFVEARPWYEF